MEPEVGQSVDQHMIKFKGRSIMQLQNVVYMRSKDRLPV